MLRGMGYVIREAADGQQALNSISKSRPDVILLNLYLPKVSGLDVLELGRRGLLEQVHFPRDTGSLTPARVICEKGARGLLPKPFRMQALWSAVEIVARGGSLIRRPRPLRGDPDRRM